MGWMGSTKPQGRLLEKWGVEGHEGCVTLGSLESSLSRLG